MTTAVGCCSLMRPSVRGGAPRAARLARARHVGKFAGEAAEIALELGKARARDAVIDEAPGLLRLHQAGLHQDLEVMADRRLRQPERTFEIARAHPILDRA